MGVTIPGKNQDGQPCSVKVTTWVRLPPECRPASWKGKYADPVVPMVRALYGHPDAGGYWEIHGDSHLKKVGFRPLNVNWPSVYFHDRLRLMLMVYVDDFKMSGPAENMAE